MDYVIMLTETKMRCKKESLDKKLEVWFYICKLKTYIFFVYSFSLWRLKMLSSYNIGWEKANSV